MWVLKNAKTEQFARHDSTGQRDGRVTDDMTQARKLASWDDVMFYAFNFGPEFQPFPAVAK